MFSSEVQEVLFALVAFCFVLAVVIGVSKHPLKTAAILAAVIVFVAMTIIELSYFVVTIDP